MRKIFVDCGYCRGEVTKEFQALFLDPLHPMYGSEFFAFEPNPYLYELFAKSNPDVTVYNQACWIFDGEVEFYNVIVDKFGRNNRLTESSTLHPVKNERNLRVHRATEKMCVPAIDFSRWLLESFSINDKIWIKMDIEGAEYQVLRKMIKDESIGLVDRLYVEFHDQKCNEASADIVDYLIDNNIPYQLWD